MAKEIVIFDARREVKKKKSRKALLLSSRFFFYLSFLGILAFFLPLVRQGVNNRSHQEEVKETQVHFSDLLRISLASVEEIPDPLFSLVIPKIGVRSKVIKNVDAGSERQYLSALREGVAHARGTAFPGGEGGVYLFAHSSVPLYRPVKEAVFARLSELEKDDQVMVYFNGIKYLYLVSRKEILEAGDLGYFFQEDGLVLQTCWPPGTSLKQLIILARPVFPLDKEKLI